ncbi:MAG TPA: fluoride efflux transporter CrcB [Solirubrobacterales bacterium]|nr:fluoride efflux transporter CrcB [Solirubrobacterales bacterium]
MSVLLWVGVALLGGAGALGRFALDSLVSSRFGRDFPLGTLAVNVSGAFLLGFLVGVSLDGDRYLLAGTAVLGSYTTFSTWMLETQRLGEDGEAAGLLLNLVLSAAVGLAAAALGRAIGGAC